MLIAAMTDWSFGTVFAAICVVVILAIIVDDRWR